MENLWKKETTAQSSNYIDLFAHMCMDQFKHLFRDLKQENPKKNNRSSTVLRLKGNNSFREHHIEKAMDYYNASLCFAEIGTENVSLVYANRSTCFLTLKMYANALKDIELAKQANYPDRLMPKLEKRQAECVQSMASKSLQRNQFWPKLTFQPHEHFVCLANVLEIKRNETFGRFIVANRDIDVEQIIMVERNFASVSIDDDRKTCTNCMKTKANFIPCPRCTVAIYCCIDCMHHDDVHKYACGQFNCVSGSMKLYIQTILIAISLFRNVDQLIEFIETIITSDEGGIPKCVICTKSQYELFFKLHISFCASEKDDFLFDAQKIYLTMQSSPAIKTLFDSLKKQRFLQHLILHHLLVTARNRFQYSSDENHPQVTEIAPMACIFNHSCAPNVFNHMINNQAVFITFRPVKKGEQLFISYLGEKTGNPTVIRQSDLMNDFGFKCECDKCHPHCSLHDRTAMKSDLYFKYVNNNYKMAFLEKTQRVVLKEVCIRFLKKYGHLPWSEEMNFISLCYLKWLFEYLNEDFDSTTLKQTN